MKRDQGLYDFHAPTVLELASLTQVDLLKPLCLYALGRIEIDESSARTRGGWK